MVTLGKIRTDTTVPDDRLYMSPLPRLHVYDHCPFCVRARMIFGIKRIKYDIIFMANDDFDGPISMVGKKMVPILEITNANGEKEVMPESMDIVRRIDNDASIGAGGPALIHKSTCTDIANLIGDIQSKSRRLLYPRFADCEVLGEFFTKEARQTFAVRHPLPAPSDYAENYKNSPQHIQEVNEALVKLESLITSTTSLNPEGLSYDDIEVWPVLRNLTLVKGLKYGPKTEKYIQHMSTKCDIPLFTKLAN
eukprot:GHVT01062140.1.p1 GENE.GHVT01062140.1~~GHVT01062140.1.p1  ORF type:complete len:251 (-),score=13.98 GHVT01062140.1:257-1009(-)